MSLGQYAEEDRIDLFAIDQSDLILKEYFPRYREHKTSFNLALDMYDNFECLLVLGPLSSNFVRHFVSLIDILKLIIEDLKLNSSTHC